MPTVTSISRQTLKRLARIVWAMGCAVGRASCPSYLSRHHYAATSPSDYGIADYVTYHCSGRDAVALRASPSIDRASSTIRRTRDGAGNSRVARSLWRGSLASCGPCPGGLCSQPSPSRPLAISCRRCSSSWQDQRWSLASAPESSPRQPRLPSECGGDGLQSGLGAGHGGRERTLHHRVPVGVVGSGSGVHGACNIVSLG